MSWEAIGAIDEGAWSRRAGCQGAFLANCQSCAFGLLLLLLSACTSLPDVQAPMPSAEDSSGQVTTLDGATPDQVLQAAEIVLRAHLPTAQFVREHESLTVIFRDVQFFLLVWSDAAETWVLETKQLETSTIASVATRASWSGAAPGLSGAYSWPVEPGFLRKELRVDYSMFWDRLRSVLESTPWPECEPEREKPFFRIQKGKVLYRTYEPLCRKYQLVSDNEDE